MTLPVEKYVAQSTSTPRFEFVVWSVSVLVICLWLGLIIAAPILRSSGLDVMAAGIYYPFSFLCHQIGTRSFHLYGEPFAVCTRCFGIYFGLVFGMLSYPLFRSLSDLQPLPRIWLLLSPIPTTIDFLLGLFGIWENTHFSRFFTGSILGVGCAFFLIPGIIEISRFFFQPRVIS